MFKPKILRTNRQDSNPKPASYRPLSFGHKFLLHFHSPISSPPQLFAITLTAALVLGIVSLFGLLVPNYSSAATDIAGSTSGYYVSVSSADTLALHLNATPGGTVGSVQDTLTVSSNTPNGYKVYISSPTSSTGSNYLCPAGVTPSTSACFTPTASANSLLALTANSWGYSLDGSSFSPVPLLGSEDTIINKTTSTSESGTSVPIYFGVKADMAMSGSYTGQVMYTAIADTSGTTRLTTISPTTTANLDGGDTLTVTIPYATSRSVEDLFNSSAITINVVSPTDPTNTNTCTISSSSNITKISSPYSGLQVACAMPAKAAGSYNVVATVTLPSGATKDFTATDQLTYSKPAPTSLAEAEYLQDLYEYGAENNLCANTPTADSTNYTTTTYTLKDKRDNKQYRVRKLKDGNCWMIDSLRLAGVSIESTNSDYTSSTAFTLPAASSSTSGASYDNATVRTNTGSFANDGYLYNWPAATAGDGTTAKTSGDVSQSICPKGWKLPSGGNSSINQSFAKLYAVSDYASSANMRSTANGGPEFTLAGSWYGGYDSQGSYGRYWSRTANGSANAYILLLDSSSVNPQNYSNKNNGRSVRCVTSGATQPLDSIAYLQDIDKVDVDSIATGTTALLKDKRDEKQYRIRKLKDGKLWMIDNLRLGTAGQALTLTSADSNVTSTVTIPASQIVSSGKTSWSGDYSSKYHIYARNDATFTETSDAGIYDIAGNDYGNLYSWYTATAGSGTTQSDGTNVSESICPKGWILPQNASGAGSFYTLYNTYYNSQSLMTTVAAKNSTVADRGPEFKLAGGYSGGVRDAGSYGVYWSRTAYGKSGSYYVAYSLYLDTSSVNPQNNNLQYLGYSVRCIAS